MSGCRSGSIHTPWHTSESRLAVKSLISLWWIKVKPPQGHVNARSTLYCAPQTHFSGIRSGFQPYFKWIVSQNAVLLKWNPCSSIGSVASQLDAPFSDASSIILRSSADASSNTCAATSAMCVDLCWEILVLAHFCSASQLGGGGHSPLAAEWVPIMVLTGSTRQCTPEQLPPGDWPNQVPHGGSAMLGPFS